MGHVAQLYGISVAHWAVRGDFLVLAALVASPSDIALTEVEGRTVPLLYGAAGRAVLAARALPDEELARLLAEFGEGGTPKLDKLKEDLRRAQRRGWADDGASLQPGVKAVAVALYGDDGKVEGACATLMLNGQFMMFATKGMPPFDNPPNSQTGHTAQMFKAFAAPTQALTSTRSRGNEVSLDVA